MSISKINLPYDPTMKDLSPEQSDQLYFLLIPFLFHFSNSSCDPLGTPCCHWVTQKAIEHHHVTFENRRFIFGRIRKYLIDEEAALPRIRESCIGLIDRVSSDVVRYTRHDVSTYPEFTRLLWFCYTCMHEMISQFMNPR